MDTENIKSLRALVDSALKEDVGKGDLTSLACLEPKPVKAAITAKSNGIVSGIKPALLAFDIVDSANIIRPLKQDGDKFEPGENIIEIEGFNQTVLTSERTALNFLGHLSGIASYTNQFVEKIMHTKAIILDTRKTTPGWRFLEKEAVVHGGGQNHRYGLYDMVLIKDNHIASAGSIASAIEMTRNYLKTPEFRLQFETKADEIEIEVEVSTEVQLREAIKAGVMRLLLDNQSTESLKHLVDTAHKINSDVRLEASGNVTLENIAEVAETGVDYISIGAITHSAKASDFSLNISE